MFCPLPTAHCLPPTLHIRRYLILALDAGGHSAGHDRARRPLSRGFRCGLIRARSGSALSLSVERHTQITLGLDRRERTVDEAAQQQHDGGNEGEHTTLVHGDSP